MTSQSLSKHKSNDMIWPSFHQNHQLSVFVHSNNNSEILVTAPSLSYHFIMRIKQHYFQIIRTFDAVNETWTWAGSLNEDGLHNFFEIADFHMARNSLTMFIRRTTFVLDK